jgi:PAT family beta-lactamase induction signal transducer AmpG
MRGVEAKAEQGSVGKRAGWLESFAVYLRKDVLIVILLGFSSGLPLALSGSTLLIWMTEAGIDLKTIGLFAAVGTPYTIKFLWAPLVDALDVPLLGRLGHRRGWLILSQLLLLVAILFLSSLDPAAQTWLVALGALLVAAASATQDIVVDAYRVDKLAVSEQAAGMAGFVAAYRIGMLASTAGVLFAVTYFEQGLAMDRLAAWEAGYKAMAVLVVVGMVTVLFASEPARSRHPVPEGGESAGNPFARVWGAALGAFTDFLQRDAVWAVLLFVVLYKLCDAFAGAMIGPFVIKMGYSREAYAAIVKGVGLAATLAGGFVGGWVARQMSLAASLWLGGILQTVANLSFTVLAMSGLSHLMLGIAITIENFTSAIGTVIFIAYLSSLCRNPLHTATQFAVLTAFAAIGRTYLSAGAGWMAELTGWPMFFVVATLTGLPAFVLLWWLQRRGHFSGVG